MTQHVEPSQASESMIRTDHADGELASHGKDCNIVENTASRAEACQKLIDKAVERRIMVLEFIQALKGLGLNAAEAHDHVDEVTQRIELQNMKSRDTNPQQGPTSDDARVENT
ncbi:hypothetical protein C0993_001971, partial [Termitomyces sp. T159_Od127]